MGLVRRTAGPDEGGAPQESPAELVARLDDAAPDSRRRAALDLDLDGVSDAVPALLRRLSIETETAVRDAILTTLATCDTDAVAGALSAYLHSDDAAVRTAVAGTLATMPRSVPAQLPALLDDADHDVRIMTAMVLADLPHPDASTWLERMIRDDPHPNVVAAAIDALLPMAGPEHVPLLQEARARFADDPFLHFTIDAALPALQEAHP